MTRLTSTVPVPSVLLLYCESSRLPVTGKEPMASSIALATTTASIGSQDKPTCLLTCRISCP